MPLRDMDREQTWPLPPSFDELLPLDHPARFVAVFVDALDKEGWAELGVEINGDPLGAPAYHPRALLCVWLYGFMTGVRSCRKLEAACRDQIPYLWLTGWQQPDHNTLWRFYKEHRQAMRRLFKRTVRTAVAMQLVDLAVQAVDGTKVAANATRDRTYDAERGRRLLDRLEKAIEDLEPTGHLGSGGLHRAGGGTGGLPGQRRLRSLVGTPDPGLCRPVQWHALVAVGHHRDATVRLHPRHPPRAAFTENHPALEVPGQSVGVVGRFLQQGDAAAGSPLPSFVAPYFAKNKVPRFVPPEGPFGNLVAVAQLLQFLVG